MNDGSGFQKRRQLLDMLDAGLVMVHLDPRPADVIVPQRFKSEPVLRLNLAYQFRLPALDIGADGVYAVLSFDRQNFGCTLPWSSIFAVTRPNAGHDGVVWPDSVPPELRASFARAGVNGPTRLQATTPPEMKAMGAVKPAPVVPGTSASVGGASTTESERGGASEATPELASTPRPEPGATAAAAVVSPAAAVAATTERGPVRPSLMVAAQGGGGGGGGGEPGEAASEAPPKRRGHLTLVKG